MVIPEGPVYPRIFLAAILLLGPFASLAFAEASVATDKRCLPISGIASTRVVDNQHIVFQMRNGDAWMNELPRKCPGLSKRDPIMYKTSQSQLCDLDIITVLNSAGGGYMPGASCGLGRFVPMTTGNPDSP